MHFYENDLRGNSDISQMPDLFQDNGEPLNPKLRNRILSGTPCEYTPQLREALKKYTFHDRIMNVSIIALMVLLILYTVTAALKSEKDAFLFLFILISVLILIIAVFAYREYANSIAVKTADKGNVRCFTYTFYGISRYEMMSDTGTTSFYFAKLEDFLVKLPSELHLPPKVTGLVINIKGTDHFYLLV